MKLPRLAILHSTFNAEITNGLLHGAQSYLAEHGLSVASQDIYSAPGAFEIPLLAQSLARSGKYSGVICLGCVIKGDTAHFEFISLGATFGIMQAMLQNHLPITFGILTTYTDEQAFKRSRNDAENKGREAAAACLSSIQIMQQIQNNSVCSPQPTLD